MPYPAAQAPARGARHAGAERVDTGSDYGSGTATLDNRGSTATLTIEGTTSAAEEVQATIECHTVTNF